MNPNEGLTVPVLSKSAEHSIPVSSDQVASTLAELREFSASNRLNVERISPLPLLGILRIPLIIRK